MNNFASDTTSKSESSNAKILVLSSTVPVTENAKEPRFVMDLCNRLAERFQIKLLTQSRPGASAKETRGKISVVRYRYAPKQLQQLSENGGLANTLRNNPAYYLIVPLLLASQTVAIFGK